MFLLNYITPRRAGLSATAGLSCFEVSSDKTAVHDTACVKCYDTATRCRRILDIYTAINANKKAAQLTLTNPRDAKACKNCSNSTCFVSFHRIPFRRISNYRYTASRGMAIGLYGYTQFEIRCLLVKFLVQIHITST